MAQGLGAQQYLVGTADDINAVATYADELSQRAIALGVHLRGVARDMRRQARRGTYSETSTAEIRALGSVRSVDQ